MVTGWMRWVGIGLLVVSLTCLIFSLKGFWEHQAFVSRADTTTAQMTTLNEDDEGRLSGIIYTYTVEGEPYTVEKGSIPLVVTHNSLDVGDTFLIYYLPDDPERHKVRNRLYSHHFLLVWCLLSGMFSLTVLVVEEQPSPEPPKQTADNDFSGGILLVSHFLLLFMISLLEIGPYPNGCFWFLSLLGLLSCIWVAFRYVPRLWRFYQRTGERACRTIADREFDTSPMRGAAMLRARREVLAELGFSSWFCSEVLCEGEPTLKVWHFRNTEQTLLASVSFNPLPMVAFSAWLPGFTLLETHYPLGENRDGEGYFIRFTDESVERAFQIHQDLLNQQREQHGDPLPLPDQATFHSLESQSEGLAYLRWEKRPARKATLFRMGAYGSLVLYALLIVLLYPLMRVDYMFAWMLCSPFTLYPVWILPYLYANWPSPMRDYIRFSRKRTDYRKKKPLP